MKPGSKSRADAFLALGLGAFFLFQLIASWRYPREAALFPRIVGGIGLAFAIVVAISGLRGRTVEHFKTDVLEPRVVVLAIAAPVVYAIALWLLGYWVATIAALLAFPRIIGYRRPVVVAITGIATAVFFGVILHYMQVRLPLGVLLTAVLDR